MSLEISRVWEMPHKYTFRLRCVQTLFTSLEVGEEWIDPFAGETSPASVTNDIDPHMPTPSHVDGLEFLRTQKGSFKGMLFDPPYSTEQALRKYHAKHGGTAGRAEYWARCLDETPRLLKPGGLLVCFGWDSNGAGKARGFALEKVLLICHGALHRDTIVTVERKRD